MSFQLFKDARVNVPEAKADLTGRTVIITGSNAGLGFQSALSVARMQPARLILAVRTVGKGEEAAKKIQEATGFSRCEVWSLDMLREESVKAFADKANVDLDRLDIALLNAGIVMSQYELSPSGNTTQLQVNTYSTILLAKLLLPKVLTTARLPKLATHADFKPHISIVGSFVHFDVSRASLPKDLAEGSIVKALNRKSDTGMGGYNITKALLFLLTDELLAQLSPAERDMITINTSDPGFCVTDFFGTSGFLLRLYYSLGATLLSRTPQTGARLLTWAATQPTSQGAFIAGGCVERNPSKFVTSDEGKAIGQSLYRELTAEWKQKLLL
ncbi:hypothetical protein QFC21_005304 [Naganishia friedmannii]|uniref:Uncharacterized protein n=1 Tax=Naganishia friedmannii TaxID=89922 RepID=A0ACC2VBJ1_9TREE|nr:hypothetical protein QFC21_005304 [Naganishia friedmannii]